MRGGRRKYQRVFSSCLHNCKLIFVILKCLSLHFSSSIPLSLKSRFLTPSPLFSPPSDNCVCFCACVHFHSYSEFCSTTSFTSQSLNLGALLGSSCNILTFVKIYYLLHFVFFIKLFSAFFLTDRIFNILSVHFKKEQNLKECVKLFST